jgi:peptide/nickel transport system ATP-binding protein
MTDYLNREAPVLELADVSAAYLARASRADSADAEGEAWALRGVSLELATGRTMAIIGRSGSGKTSLCRAVVGLLPLCAGTIRSGGEIIASRRRTSKAARAGVQMIWQDPFASLDPRMKIGEAVGEARQALAEHRAERRAALRSNIEAALERVGLPADFADLYPHQISGGQRQRVCLARALAAEPKLVLLDEPFASLDLETAREIAELLLELRRGSALALLLVTHDLDLAGFLADEIAVLERGEIVERGSAERVMAAPQHESTRSLLQAVGA